MAQVTASAATLVHVLVSWPMHSNIIIEAWQRQGKYSNVAAHNHHTPTAQRLRKDMRHALNSIYENCGVMVACRETWGAGL